MKFKHRLHRLTHWEYWPMWTLYLPLIPYYCYLSLKARSFGFFNATNPGLVNGGMTLDAKSMVANILPKKYQPAIILIAHTSKVSDLGILLNEKNISFPLIVKPDVGCRGLNVHVIENRTTLEHHLSRIQYDVVIQSYIDYPIEIGVFYYKYPQESKGFVSGIVQKKGITITGDKKKDVATLILESSRYAPHFERLKRGNHSLMSSILAKGESLILSTIGNHARGATFYDVSYQNDVFVEKVINEICDEIDGFFYGRFDLKINSWEEFKLGLNFKIIELNGAVSEPIHMYDPSHSYFFALSEMKRHWKIMYAIAKQNKQNGYTYLSILKCYKLLKSSINTHRHLQKEMLYKN